jgi:hypothetical protein
MQSTWRENKTSFGSASDGHGHARVDFQLHGFLDSAISCGGLKSIFKILEALQLKNCRLSSNSIL